MSNRRYIEFDSTYRNRECYPCPADYKVKVTCTKNSSNGTNANDYVAKEYPSNSWYQLPYAGSDVDNLFKSTSFPSVSEEIAFKCKIPYMINGEIYSSLWPVDWMNGTASQYFSTYRNPAMNPIYLPGTGVVGTRFDIDWANPPGNAIIDPSGLMNETPFLGVNLNYTGAGAAGPVPSPDLYLTDTIIRTMNILSPDRFAGGTPAAPRLGYRAIQQAPINNYFAGAKLLRFTRNPVMEVLQQPDLKTPEGDGVNMPLLGSLGFSFFYQKLTIPQPAPSLIQVGKYIKQGTECGGYIASILNSNEILVRLTSILNPVPPSGFGIDPIQNGTFPGALENHCTFTTSGIVILANLQPPYAAQPATPLTATDWGTPSAVSEVQRSYLIDTFVESSIIESYDGLTGDIILETPFSDNGTNGFNVERDFYLISFNTDPSGYWTSNPISNINPQNRNPRVFFPTGAKIPNYYSNVLLEDICASSSGVSVVERAETVVSSYDDQRRVLNLKDAFDFNLPLSNDIGNPPVSTFAVVFVKHPRESGGIPCELPAGTIIAWRGTGTVWPPPPTVTEFDDPVVYRVAITAPPGSTSIVLEAPLSNKQSILLLPCDAICFYVCPPPWYRNVLCGPGGGLSVYDTWIDPANFPYLNGDDTQIDQNRGCISIAGLFGATTIAVRGQFAIPDSRSAIPNAPRMPENFPNSTAPVMIRNGAVFELTIKEAGTGYSITDPTMPILALLAIPTDFVAFTDFNPPPEEVSGIFTFLNICFVNVLAVDKNGGILKVSVNTPGSGYQQGAILFLIDGTGVNIQTQNVTSPVGSWTLGSGSGASARVTGFGQSIGFMGGTNLPAAPVPGDSVYIPTYGWGYSSTEKTLYNSAPDLGIFVMNFSGTENVNESHGFVSRASEVPLRVQGCECESKSYPETGVRLILYSFKSINNQVLISQNTTVPPTFQYAAPGAYLGGLWFLQNNYRYNSDPLLSATGSQNSVTWVGLQHGFDLNNFQKQYQVTNLDYVDPQYAWGANPIVWNPDIPPGRGQWADHRYLPPGNSSMFALQRGNGILPASNLLSQNVVQVLSFDHDNEVPLNYTGSTVSQNQMVCYEIELLSLVLPNIPLDNNIGGLIAFYPYLYVELSNVSAPSSGNRGIIYSNNPNANCALFRVAIDDTPTPTISKFIKIDGNGAVQTVKFKPNDNLHLRVFLQNGKLFETQTNDTTPPLPPDPFVQISAQFMILRVS